jgi:YjbE family integral membrane protein
MNPLNFINTFLHSVNWPSIPAILLLDIVLSGDNALVIGTAAAGLPRHQRIAAIIMGMVGAFVLRVILVGTLTVVLKQVPIISLLAGVILVWVACSLMPIEEEAANGARSASFGKAVLVIFLADITMSLDNVIAIGVLANGNIGSIVIGLAMSILLLMVGSSLIATIVVRYPWLIYLAALVVGWVAGEQIWHSLVGMFPALPMQGLFAWAVPSMVVIFIGVVILRHLFKK